MIPGPQPIAGIRGVRKTFAKASGGELLVLDDIDLDLPDGKIVCLLGRSGSGKSTLLRIIAGLLAPTRGEVCFEGRPVRGPAPGIAMVFQSFALFPWLTVLENVQVGLEALGLPRSEIRSRALEAIDLIGLDGFESAYPKELSGGMRQRVGFARAIVIHPKLLLMDEAFSALDVVTAENLRAEFLDLWHERRLPIRSVLMVTHNIEEAVLMGDRIVILSTNPGRVSQTLEVSLPRPRDRFDPDVREAIDSVYALMTARPLPHARPPAGAAARRITERLHAVSTASMAGLLEILSKPPFDGKADLPVLAALLHLEGDDLFPVVEMLHRLGFADVAGGDILLSDDGRRFVAADTEARKAAFRVQLRHNVALADHIRTVLDSRPRHRAPLVRFREELEDQLSPEDADETLRAVTDWGRY
ncbi:MAG TPA: nitrate/sulfonate/bicarbonate ABC transporter ATP-binding protein, partial [Vulgatibacter sp.]